MGAALIRSVSRSALFAVTGIEPLVLWIVAHPTSQVTAQQGTWPRVLWFSATLLLLGIAVLVFGWMVGGKAVKRWATIAAAAVSLASLANLIEDGFRVEEAFLLFVLSMATFDIALIGLTVVVFRTAPSRYRLLAVIPAAPSRRSSSS